MHIRRKKGWEMPEREATPERVFMNRREFMKSAGVWGLGAGVVLTGLDDAFEVAGLFGGPKKVGKEDLIRIPRTPTSHLYPARRNAAFTLERDLTEELVAARYNNFYEFSSRKNVWEHVNAFPARPWAVEVAGLVKRPATYDVDELVRKVPLEERLYRFRCVEAWAMAVPWTGFPMRELVKMVEPLSSSKYIRLQTLHNKDLFPAQKLRFWLPWPYEEGLTMEEATNELTLLATGIYGHELPAQHGSPIRLIVPWKYGYKSIKSIVRMEFTEERPRTFWNTLVPEEYDFTSNVNPEVPHPRWSQATERMLGTDEIRKTVKYNGYAEYVARLYK